MSPLREQPAFGCDEEIYAVFHIPRYYRLTNQERYFYRNLIREHGAEANNRRLEICQQNYGSCNCFRCVEPRVISRTPPILRSVPRGINPTSGRTLNPTDVEFQELSQRDIEHQYAWDQQTERVRQEILEDFQSQVYDIQSAFYYEVPSEDELPDIHPPRRRRSPFRRTPYERENNIRLPRTHEQILEEVISERNWESTTPNNRRIEEEQPSTSSGRAGPTRLFAPPTLYDSDSSSDEDLPPANNYIGNFF